MKQRKKPSDKRVKARLFPVSVFLVIFVLAGVFTTAQMMLIGDYIDVDIINGSGKLVAVFLLHWLVVATGGAVWMGYQVNRRFQRPIEKFAEAARQVAGGDFSVYIQPRHTEDKADSLDVIFSDFNKMVEELGSIETLKVDFFANVSHEIKTPLAAIQNYAQLLQNTEITPEKRQDYTMAIVESTHRLSNLITNMLKLNKLESQKLNPVPIAYDLCRQLEECVIGLEQVWEEKEMELEVDLEERVMITADESLMEIVWNNLLSNALKFTEPGGNVSIRQTSDPERITVIIKDSGYGMSEQTMKHIFDKFYQGDTSHSTEGNGLGLALVWRILQITGASISVESEEGRGTEFTVLIPAVIRKKEEISEYD